MRRQLQKNSKKVKLKFIISLLIFCTFTLLFLSKTEIPNTNAATQQDAYNAIKNAFELIEEASEKGLNITKHVSDLNTAISAYDSGYFNNAHDIAQDIIDDVEELIDNYRTGRLFPYILIPFNIALVASLVVFFGRNVKDWYQKRRDEEFLELEIVYENSDVNS